MKEVFSDATVFIADFGLFLHHIGSDSNSGMTLEEPSRLSDRDVRSYSEALLLRL